MANKVKGISIKLNADTSGIDKALKDVNKSLYGTEDELKKVDKLLKYNPKDVTILTQKQNLLTSAIKDTTSKLEQLKKMKELADADDNVDKESKEYRELQRQIAEATNKLKNFETQSNNVGNSLNNTSEELSTFGAILKANLTSGAIIGAIKSIGSAIKQGVTDLVDLVKGTSEYADEVNTLAKQYNLTTKEIQQYIKASDLIDVDINTIAKSMSKLTKNMTSTSNGVVEAFKELGIVTKESDGSLRDSNQVFNEVIEALGKIENETEQDAIALEIFGKSASDLGPLINGGLEQLKELNKGLEENNALLSQEELDSLNDLNDSFGELELALDSVKEKVVAELAPVIQPLVEELTGYILDNKDDIVTFVQDVIEWLTGDEGKEMFDSLKEAVSNVAEFISNFPALKQDLELLVLPLKLILDTLNGIVSACKWLMNNEFLQSGRLNGASSSRYGFQNGMYGNLNSGGYGALLGDVDKALTSGGYNTKNSISMTNSFVVNSALDEKQAKEFVKYVGDELNEYLGKNI